tara:strand:- start:5602 stop:6129 length:528 start_codon:yes stop_codon:yes gene_type:complete
MMTMMLASLKVGGVAAAGAGAAGAAAGAGALGTLSTALTVVGGLASIMSGAKQKSALDQQATDEDTRATQETIQGRQDALSAMRALNQDQAQIAVAGYASGIGGGEGSAAAAQEEARKVGDQNFNLSRDNAAFQSSARRNQGRQYRDQGQGAFTSGLFGAVKGGISLFQRREVRG